MTKWLWTALLAALAIGAGYFFGTVCKRVMHAYELVLDPSLELVKLLAWLLLAMYAVVVAGGVVAALVRPVWVGIIVFALSGMALVLGWQVALVSTALALISVLCASLYAVGVAKELKERIRFSVRPVTGEQGLLVLSLALLACGSLYVGYAEHIEREGFSVPETYVETLGEQIERQIEARVPERERQEVLDAFREEFRRGVDEFFDQTVKPNERYIPLIVAGGVFTPLVTVTRLLAWLPSAILSIIFPLLRALRITEVVRETKETERLVIR